MLFLGCESTPYIFGISYILAYYLEANSTAIFLLLSLLSHILSGIERVNNVASVAE